MLGPSLLRFGNDEQRRRLHPADPVRRGDLVPGLLRAGGRLGSRQPAHARGPGWRQLSSSTARRRGCRGVSTRRWCGLLARTDDSVPRHRGISMLIVDMSSPGVEVRPMTQITGHAEFSELFLDDVVVPTGEPARPARRRVEDRDAHARARAGNRGAAPAGQAADLARPRGVASPPGARSTVVRCSRIRRRRPRWLAP